MTTFVMAHVDITDADAFGTYTSQFAPTLQPFEGSVVLVSDSPEVLEGEWPPGRTVVLSFPTQEQARDWYNSDEYQRISQFRRASSNGSLVLADAL